MSEEEKQVKMQTQEEKSKRFEWTRHQWLAHIRENTLSARRKGQWKKEWCAALDKWLNTITIPARGYEDDRFQLNVSLPFIVQKVGPVEQLEAKGMLRVNVDRGLVDAVWKIDLTYNPYAVMSIPEKLKVIYRLTPTLCDRVPYNLWIKCLSRIISLIAGYSKSILPFHPFKFLTYHEENNDATLNDVGLNLAQNQLHNYWRVKAGLCNPLADEHEPSTVDTWVDHRNRLIPRHLPVVIPAYNDYLLLGRDATNSLLEKSISDTVRFLSKRMAGCLSQAQLSQRTILKKRFESVFPKLKFENPGCNHLSSLFASSPKNEFCAQEYLSRMMSQEFVVERVDAETTATGMRGIKLTIGAKPNQLDRLNIALLFSGDNRVCRIFYYHDSSDAHIYEEQVIDCYPHLPISHRSLKGKSKKVSMRADKSSSLGELYRLLKLGLSNGNQEKIYRLEPAQKFASEEHPDGKIIIHDQYSWRKEKGMMSALLSNEPHENLVHFFNCHIVNIFELYQFYRVRGPIVPNVEEQLSLSIANRRRTTLLTDTLIQAGKLPLALCDITTSYTCPNWLDVRAVVLEKLKNREI